MRQPEPFGWQRRASGAQGRSAAWTVRHFERRTVQVRPIRTSDPITTLSARRVVTTVIRARARKPRRSRAGERGTVFALRARVSPLSPLLTRPKERRPRAGDPGLL